MVRLGPHSFIALVVQDWVNNRLDALRAYVVGPEAGLSTVLFGLGAVEISIAALVATVLCALLFCMLFRAKSTSPLFIAILAAHLVIVLFILRFHNWKRDIALCIACGEPLYHFLAVLEYSDVIRRMSFAV